MKDVEIATRDTRPVLTFTLVQQTATPYSLIVPIRIRTMAGVQTVNRRAEEAETKVAIPLAERPLEFVVDPDHDFLRRLTHDEYPAVWSRFLGSDKKLAILGGEEDRELFRPLLETSLGESLTLKTDDQVTDRDLLDHDLLFLGAGRRARSLLGPPPKDNPGFLLDVHHNPLNGDRVAVLMTGNSRLESEAVARRLSHYGKYSTLAFTGGRNTAKQIEPVESGLHTVFDELPRGGATADLAGFASIVGQLADAQVVYVGESHTEWADHLLQLRLIEALYHQDPQLAIGMEMFPMNAQPVLDRYTQGQEPLDEPIFLKESGYFDVWSYDWRYYRDILNFARNHHLPVIGLNLDRQIVTEVFRTGGTDSLAPEVRATLPENRDLDLDGYTERLTEMHAVHVEGGHGSGGMPGFVQAQALWDETMAENVSRFLHGHPGYRLVVLAGSQHTRKDSGIPPRVARRLPVQQAVVENVTGEGSLLDLARRTDYYFFFSATDLPETPKIGVILSTETKDGSSRLLVDQVTENGKAAEAGIKEGDIITKIGGKPVTDMADVRIAMLDTRPGNVVDVVVLRREGGEERTLNFQVELTVPPLSPHP